MISTAIQQLVNYGLDTGLILPDDEIYIRNQLLMTMQLDSFTEPEGDVCYADLESILKTLVDDAAARGVCDDSPTARDLFDTRLMGVLTPRPSIVRANFEERYETDGPQAPPTGSTSSARTPITSAATASSGTSSGSPRPPTATSTSPSTCRSPKKTPKPSQPQSWLLRAPTPSASSAWRTRAMPVG